jgi:hypothetical protein
MRTGDLSVVLYAGENDHLLELELIRSADGELVDPDWSSIEVT